MPPKKQPYVYFCLEKQQTDPRLKNKSLPELIELCGEEWRQLGQTERQGYVETAMDMAKGRTQPPPITKPNQDVSGKFDAQGRSFLAMRSKDVQEKRFKMFMQKDIARRTESEEVVDYRFHIMAVNIWMEVECTGDIIPVEISLVEMSLRKGILRKYLQLIDPGQVPPGFKADMKINSDKYHNLWLDHPDLTDAYSDIVDTLSTVLRTESDELFAGEGMCFQTEGNVSVPDVLAYALSHKLLPIYVMPDKRKLVERSLAWLVKQSGMDYCFALYDLDYLFMQLVLAAPQDGPTKMTQPAAEAHLTRDVFLYLPTVSCRFHDQAESSKCAGARAARLSYIISDFCCQLYGIRPDEGCHLPWGLSADTFILDTTAFNSTSHRTTREISFLSDSKAINSSKLEDLPIYAVGGAVSGLHILNPFLVAMADQEYKSVQQLLNERAPVAYDFEECGADSFLFRSQNMSQTMMTSFDGTRAHQRATNITSASFCTANEESFAS